MRLFVARDVAVFTRHFADEITPLLVRGHNDVAHLDPLEMVHRNPQARPADPLLFSGNTC